MTIVGLVLLFVLGIAMIFFPSWLWALSHILWVRKGEPSELYIALLRVGGVACIIGGLIVLIMLIADVG